MGKHETITAQVDEALVLTVREAVESGDYASVSDVVAHALAEWRLSERAPKISPDELQALLAASLADDPEGTDAEQVFNEVLSEIDALIDADEKAG